MYGPKSLPIFFGVGDTAAILYQNNGSYQGPYSSLKLTLDFHTLEREQTQLQVLWFCSREPCLDPESTYIYIYIFIKRAQDPQRRYVITAQNL